MRAASMARQAAEEQGREPDRPAKACIESTPIESNLDGLLASPYPLAVADLARFGAC